MVKDIYETMKLYIPAKELQNATDQLVDVLQEHLPEEEIYRLRGLDNNISRSIDDALGEPEEFYDEDELDDWE